MTTKTDFTPEAWQAILAAPVAITQLVMTASFGLGDVHKGSSHAQSAVDVQRNDVAMTDPDLSVVTRRKECTVNF